MILGSLPRVARFALLALFSVLAASAQTTLVDDTFADGNRTGQTPPSSLNWFLNSGSGLTSSATAGSFQFNNTASRLLVGYFTASGAPVAVPNGQSITLEITFSSNVTPAAVTNGFNLALFNSGGSRVAADFSGTSNAAFASYDGYGVKTSGLGSTSGSNVSLRQRNAGTSTALMSTSGDWATIASASGTTTAAAANVTYVATITITNNGTSAALAYTLKTSDGATTLQSLAGTDTGTVVSSFDAVALYIQTAEFPSGNLNLQRVRVTTTGGGSSGTAPAFTTQPVSQSANPGDTITFTGAASGNPTPTYQWNKNGAAIAGATAASLTLTGVQAGDAADYTVVATNSVGSATSAVATLTVVTGTAPAIATPPVAQTVNVGDTATFSVTATGTDPLSYQWKKDGANVNGATGATLILGNVQPSNAGSYSVVVSNAAGSVTSAAATLTVNSAPAITAQPQPVATTVGSNATFSVNATGTPTPTYQWRKNGADLAGATAATLTLSSVQFDDAATYSVVVTNSLGSVTSNGATLAVSAPSPLSRYNLTGFATLNGGTTGGGVVAETDPAYVKVTTPLELANALIAAAKTAGAVKVIEIMNDLNLGWNEVGATVQGLASNPFRSHATPKLHPVLINTGVSLVDIKPKSGLTIFSANGATIRHATFNIKAASNLIVRNLRFDEMWEWDEASKGDYDSNDWDFITLSNGGAATNIWIDHCTFTKAYDGIVDMKAGTQYVTLSWCKYVGDDGATNANSFVRQQLAALEANRSSYAFYNFLRTNGFSVEDIATIIQGHDKGHLMGSNSLDSQNATLTATFHHQWFANLWDRCVPRLRAGNVHNYNIYVDDTAVLAAKRLRDSRAAALTSALLNTLNNTYSFNPPINGSISTEGGALLLEKSTYIDCLWPLRNNQTDPSNAVYTGKIMALDSRYVFHNADGSIVNVRGNSTDAGNPMGPFQAAIIPFSWNGYTSVPYSYTPDDPDDLPALLATGAGAGALTWSKDNWLKTAYVDLITLPTITTPPAAQTVGAGASATFSVVASGASAYQWTMNGAPIVGATTSALTLNNVQAGDAGSYAVVVTNLAGSVTSASAALTVAPAAPTITTPPVAQTASVGGSAAFSVVVTGTAPFAFQWTHDGAPIANANSSTLTLAAVQASDAGDYAVIVSNSVGSTTSAAVALAISVPPTITTPPTPQIAAAGGSATFTVVAAGSAPLAYQWQKDGAAIAGATSATLVLSAVQVNDAGSYSVAVTNAAGSVTSAAATLIVTAPPVIVGQPASQSVLTGATVTFGVTVNGSGPFSYQWYRNGVAIAGATGDTFTLVNAQVANAGGYSVTIANIYGAAASVAATLEVNVPGAGDLYVAPDGLASSPGTLASPTTLDSAITRVPAGSTIYLRGGTYSYSVGVTIAAGNNGTASALKRIFAYPGEQPVLDFSAQAVLSTNRGLTLNGNYWHVRGVIVQRSGDNGIFIGGNNNIVERCITRFNADTGLQLGRISSTMADIAQWPANNLILNCESHDNKDPANENADGFACKLTTGPGNVFRGCISHNNIDDGWDLFTKTDTGPIGSVTLDQCISYNNGVLSDGSSSGSGDKNGFKLGGEDIAVVHVVTRCIAFGNGKNGFTWNSNPGAIRMINNLAFNNAQGNYKFDQAGPLFYNNVSLWTTGSGVNDRYGGNSGIATGSSNVFWFASGTPKSRNDQGIQVSTASFVSLAVPAGGFARNADGSIALGDFARPVTGSPLINAGTLPASLVSELSYSASDYYEGAPDIGVVETYLLPRPVAPTITVPPSATTVPTGGSAVFSVTATGTAPLSYQWFKGTSPISGATTSTLTLTGVQAADAGSYSVSVTNSVGSVTSDAASLTVTVIAPSIATQPGGQTVIAFSDVSFTTSASGTAPFTYQWFKDNAPIAGATGARLFLASVPTSAAGAYTVAVTNSAGTAVSNAAVLTVNKAAASVTVDALSAVYDGGRKPVNVTTGPAGLAVEVTYGGSAVPPTDAGNYTVVATIVDANYSGATTATLVIAKASASVVLGNLGATYDGAAKAASITTVPAGLGVRVTYDGSLTMPVDAGSYRVVVAITDANYSGGASDTLTINPANASIALDGLSQTYDGSPKTVVATTTPAGLTVQLTYDGQTSAPTNAGTYSVAARVTNPNYTGSAGGVLAIGKATATIALAGLDQVYDGAAKSVGATTSPGDLSVQVTYDGSTAAPSAAGSYTVAATVNTANYTGHATGTLTIAKAPATIALDGLRQAYDGTPKNATAITNPTGLAVTFTYDGSATAPTIPGIYAVVATLTDANYRGAASGSLVISATALVRHAPTLNGEVDGSVQVLSPESFALNGSALVSGDLLVPGSPAVNLNGHPTYVSTLDGAGSSAPANYAITLSGSAVLRHVVRRTDAIAMPVIPAPAALANPRNVTLNGNSGQVTLAPGTYGTLAANGSSGFILGVAGDSVPAIYNVQSFVLNGGTKVQIVGPVIINLASGISLNGTVGHPQHAEWLALNVAAGGVTLNGSAVIYGNVVAPDGTVTINAGSALHGRVTADRLVMNGAALLSEPENN